MIEALMPAKDRGPVPSYISNHYAHDWLHEGMVLGLHDLVFSRDLFGG